jgi:fibronectin-binding autotransporter adhesin
MKNKLRFIAFLAASHGLLHTTATASSLEWKGSTTGLGGGTNQTWDTDTTANWWDGASLVKWPAPGGTDDDAVFGGTAGTITITTATANDITFNTNGYTLSGGTLTLNGTTPTITVGGGSGASISSTINGSSGLVKAGGGGLTLSGANGYSGGTTLSGGAITVGNNSALGSGTLTMNGGTLTAGVGPTTTLSNSLQIDGSGSVFNAPSGANLELNGNMTGSGSVSVAGQWAVSLGGNNSGFTGTWTSGSENPNNITSFANANSGSASAAWVLNGGRMVNGNNSSPTISLGSLSGSGGILSNNTSGLVTYSVGGLNTNTTFSGQIQNAWGGGGTTAITKVGSGTWTLTGNNSYSGGTTISGGTIVVGNNSALGSGTIVMNGGTLRAGVSPTTTLSNSLQIDGTGNVFSAPFLYNLELNGNITGSGSVSVAGEWAVALGGNNSGFAGTWTSGSENPNNITRFSTANSGSAGAQWVLNGGRMVSEAAGGSTISLGSLSGTGGILSNNTGGLVTFSIGALNTNTTFSGQIQNAWGGGGTTAITKVGTGQWTVSGNNTYTGPTIVSGGTLELSGTNANGNLQVNGAGALARITGGTTTLASTDGNTYVTGGGTLEIDGGSLVINGGAAYFPVGQHPSTPAGDGTLTLTSGSFTNNNSWGIVLGESNAGTGTINVNGGTFTANDTFNNSGIILYKGVVNLNGGTLITDKIGGSGPGTVNFNGGKLQATGDVADILPNNGNITTTIQSGGLKVGGTPNFTISEGMGGTGGLTKENGNTVTLSGTNGYSGATTVSAGTLALSGGGSIASSAELIVDGTLDVTGISAGTFTVGAAQTLSGNGTVNASGKTLSIEGTHAVGSSPGQQDVTGNLSYASGSIFEWDLDAGTSDPGANTANSGTYDQVGVTGNLTGGGSTFKIVLGLNAFIDAFWNTNKSWSNIFTAGNAFDLGTIFTSFSGSGVDSSGLVAGQGTFTLSSTTLTWTAVPEPTSALAGLLLTAGLLRRRRR